MKLKVFHKTVYHYTEPIKRSIQIIRLTPLSSGHQQVINWQVSLPTITIPSQDCFGNQTHCLIVDTPVSQIEIIAEGLIETFIAAPNPWLGKVPLEYYLNYTPLTSPSSEIINFIKLGLDSNEKFFIAPFDLSIILESLHQLSAKILERVGYQSGTTNATTTAAQAFVNGAGVCQDHSHIFLACCRYLGLPSRYVSGYLFTHDQEHLSSHAWTEVWLNQAWHSFDISNQCSAGEQHIELAYGLDYLDAGPIRGSRVSGGTEKLNVLSLVSQQ